MTKIDLITGILGSGKTTFIRKYASYLINKGERIAILENDFGAVNVDMMILQDLKCDNCTIEMILGGGDHDCHRRRFKTQLISLGMQNFDRVIVEPSGIFDMDEFFDLLYESPLDRWFTVGSVIGITDAEMDDVLSEQMEYLLASESSCCGKLVLSKTEGKSVEELEETAEKVLVHINHSMAEISCDRILRRENILARNWDSFTEKDYEELINAGYVGARYIKKYSPDDIISCVHYFMNIDIPQELIGKVTDSILRDEACGRIFRIKGALPCGGDWIKVNATQEKTELSPVKKGQAVLIVIGDYIDKERIDIYLKEYNRDPGYVSV